LINTRARHLFLRGYRAAGQNPCAENVMDTKNKTKGDHHKDLRSREAIEKIKELVDKAKYCFFCTRTATTESNGTRPMGVQKTDEQGVLWFVSPKESHKNKEISMDPSVQLYFHGSAHSDFLYLKGNASIYPDRSKIEELWDPILKAWFTEGKDDPRISIIKFVPEEGYYWDSKDGNVVATVKMLVGAITGNTPDDSIEGKINV
jgi:general stress protein 26